MMNNNLPFDEIEIGGTFRVLPEHDCSWDDLRKIIMQYKTRGNLRFRLKQDGYCINVTRIDDYTGTASKNITYTVRSSSVEMFSLIARNAFGKKNPLPKQATRLPFNELLVGMSIWIDMDETPIAKWRSARLACMRYHKIYNGSFEWVKHRGDKRLSGYKFLEIGRIK